MSYTLYESNTEKILLKKELGFIKNYFELEKMRYPTGSDVVCQIEVEASLKSLKIAPLLTFTFIENAFKYGLKSNHEKYLKMDITVHDDVFNFYLQNDCSHHNKDNILGGIGIENTKKRLQLLYPNQYELEINNADNKFEVRLKINLVNK